MQLILLKFGEKGAIICCERKYHGRLCQDVSLVSAGLHPQFYYNACISDIICFEHKVD